MYKKILIIISVILLVIVFIVIIGVNAKSEQKKLNVWEFESIDTMKYSRDLSREKLNDTSFDVVINQQVKEIAETGATHVAIATPYDEEFYPILKRWVDAARRNDLNVWFRGNWSGWEGWFEYPKITRQQHIQKTQDFIINNQELFQDGDVFSACPECENGGPGDPRQNGDLIGHRQFLIDEYMVTKSAFKEIKKDVKSNFNSMNGDVAKLVMDKDTTRALDGLVVVDHYVEDPEMLNNDLSLLSESSGGKIVLGEFGAPIPDIHGMMSEEGQSAWIKKAFYYFFENDAVVGMSYWTNVGGSTQLWNSNGSKRGAVEVVKSFYDAPIIRLRVENELGFVIKNFKLIVGGKEYVSDRDGNIYFPYFDRFNSIEVSAPSYNSNRSDISKMGNMVLILKKEKESILFKALKVIKNNPLIPNF